MLIAVAVHWGAELQHIVSPFADAAQELNRKIKGGVGVPDTARWSVLWWIPDANGIADNGHVKDRHPAPSAGQEQCNCSFSNRLVVRIFFMISPYRRKVFVGIVQDQTQKLVFDLQSLHSLNLGLYEVRVAFIKLHMHDCHLLHSLHIFGIVADELSDVDGTRCRMPFEVGSKEGKTFLTRSGLNFVH